MTDKVRSERKGVALLYATSSIFVLVIGTGISLLASLESRFMGTFLILFGILLGSLWGFRREALGNLPLLTIEPGVHRIISLVRHRGRVIVVIDCLNDKADHYHEYYSLDPEAFVGSLAPITAGPDDFHGHVLRVTRTELGIKLEVQKEG